MMKKMPFHVHDCALICRTANGYPAINLRELRERVESCPRASLYHHFCESRLRASFDDPEYHNDFAAWATHGLRDAILAERLGVLNPYDFANLEDLRTDTLDIIDDRLAEVELIPWALPGEQFFFMQAMTVVFDTAVKIDSVPELLTVVRNMTLGSLYFHFIEARRRDPLGQDDFTVWLITRGDEGRAAMDAIAGVEYYFCTLRELRERLLTVLGNCFAEETAS